MKLIIDNVTTEVVIGGADNLLSIDLAKELDDYLSIKSPGAYFARQKGRKGWDGKIHYFRNNKFPTGFLSTVSTLLVELNVEPEIIDQRKNLPFIKTDLITTFGDKELREDQINLVKKINRTIDIGKSKLYFPRGILDAATNAGKTLTMTAIAKLIEEPRILFLIHSDLVYKQAVKHFSEFYDVGEINSKVYNPKKEFTIAMAKTLFVRAASSMDVQAQLKNNYNTLFVDEAHRAGGKEYSALVRVIDAGCRVFVSGTPLDNSNKIGNINLVAVCAEVVGKVTNKELIAGKVSRRPIVYIHRVKTKIKQLNLTYAEEKENLINNCQERLQRVQQIIERDISKSTLIAFIEKQAGFNIYEQLLTIAGINIDTLHGTSGNSKVKADKLKHFISGATNVLIGSKVLQEGLNMPNIKRLILYTGGMSIITLLQFIGRALRANGDETVEIHDFFDESGQILAKHSRKRIKLYKSEGFEVVELVYNDDGTETITDKFKSTNIR